MSDQKRKVLVTGCSDGGLGAALAVAFHNAGLEVYATARNVSKMSHLASLGIQTIPLDVQSESSIAACVGQLSSLDILVNNAGALSTMPVSDLKISEAKKLFDINVWAHVAVTQAFLPLLLQSPKGMIVNQTSVQAVAAIPFEAIYGASKAALAMISDTLRLELKPFGIKVVDLRTGCVQTNIYKSQLDGHTPSLPENSIFAPAKEVVEQSVKKFEGAGQPQTSGPRGWSKTC